jgi:hypothetical protein
MVLVAIDQIYPLTETHFSPPICSFFPHPIPERTLRINTNRLSWVEQSKIIEIIYGDGRI